MEIQYLQYFVSVAELSSFSRAAEACHVSQPALSAQIKKLEDILECQLFFRSKRSVQLTPEGAELLPKAKNILGEIKQMSRIAQDLKNPLRGKVALGFSSVLSLCRAFCTVKKMESKYPEMTLSYEEDDSHKLVERLRSGELDVVFLQRLESLDNDALRYKVFEKNKLVSVIAKTHLKNSKTATSYIAPRTPGCPLGRLVQSAAESAPHIVKTRVFANDLMIIKRMVEIGIGWSVFPEGLITEKDREHFQVSTIPGHSVEYVVAVNKGRRSEALLEAFTSVVTPVRPKTKAQAPRVAPSPILSYDIVS